MDICIRWDARKYKTKQQWHCVWNSALCFKVDTLIYCTYIYKITRRKRERSSRGEKDVKDEQDGCRGGGDAMRPEWEERIWEEQEVNVMSTSTEGSCCSPAEPPLRWRRQSASHHMYSYNWEAKYNGGERRKKPSAGSLISPSCSFYRPSRGFPGRFPLRGALSQGAALFRLDQMKYWLALFPCHPPVVPPAAYILLHLL